MTRKQNFCYTPLNIGSKKKKNLNKINCPKNNIIILPTKSKKLTTKQSIIITNKKPQIPKIFTVSFSFLLCSLALCLSHSFSSLLLGLAAWLKHPFFRSNLNHPTAWLKQSSFLSSADWPFFFAAAVSAVLRFDSGWVMGFDFCFLFYFRFVKRAGSWFMFFTFLWVSGYRGSW